MSVPLLFGEEVVFRGLWRLLLLVSTVTVVASLSVLLVVLAEAASEPIELRSEWESLLEPEVEGF